MQAAVNDASEKEKVATLEAKVKDLREAVTKNPLEEKVAELELNLTNINSSMSKPNDKKSRKSCAICSKTFLKNADLEKHMSDYDATRDFECAVCGKKFFLDWRRKKRAQMHTVIPRTCRYFSSKMPCLSTTTQRYTDSESRLGPRITKQRHTVSPRTDPPYPRHACEMISRPFTSFRQLIPNPDFFFRDKKKQKSLASP